MNSHPTLHFICGKIASGKTTLAREIAKEDSTILICEDQWLLHLYGDGLKTFEDYIKYTNRMKVLLATHIKDLLRSGVSVVLDFAGNVPKHRAWVRSVFESAQADHLLHVLDVSDEECKRRLKKRNLEKPEGLYWGKEPTDQDFEMITKYFSLPDPQEGFKTKFYGPK